MYWFLVSWSVIDFNTNVFAILATQQMLDLTWEIPNLRITLSFYVWRPSIFVNKWVSRDTYLKVECVGSKPSFVQSNDIERILLKIDLRDDLVK